MIDFGQEDLSSKWTHVYFRIIDHKTNDEARNMIVKVPFLNVLGISCVSSIYMYFRAISSMS